MRAAGWMGGMKLYTKTGDDGQTSLFDGSRVSKDDLRVWSYGELDELNATLGLCCGVGASATLISRVQQVQSDLFCLGAELATPEGAKQSGFVPHLADADVTRLEGWIDEACAATPPIRHFVLPGGTELAARLHLARTVCRRAERATVHLGRETAVRNTVVVYLNRLSDLLFAWSRWVNHEAGCPEVIWNPKR